MDNKFNEKRLLTWPQFIYAIFECKTRFAFHFRIQTMEHSIQLIRFVLVVGLRTTYIGINVKIVFHL